MPHYRFNLVSDCARLPAREGIDLVDVQAARREAILIASELVKPGLPAQQRKWKGWTLQVADEQGEILSVSFAEFFAGAERLAPLERIEIRAAERRTALTSETLRLTADAMRHVERFEHLRRELSAAIERARSTVGFSARLIEESRSLTAALGLH